MSQQAPEGNGHPAWQEYLKDVPEALQPVVQSAFQQWETKVNARIQDIHNQYAPLKAFQPLIDNNIPLEYVGNALQFAQEFEKDPNALVTRINDQMNLGFVSQEEAQRQAPNLDDPFAGDDVDIENHPVVKRLMETMQTMQSQFDERTQEEQADAEQQQFLDYLDQITEPTAFKGDDDAKMLIAAFMSQGLDGPTALAKVQGSYVQSLSNQANENLDQQQDANNGEPNPLMDAINASIGAQIGGQPVGHTPPEENSGAPVVMGSEGNAGSGVPAAPIDFGALKTDDLNSLVADIFSKTNDS